MAKSKRRLHPGALSDLLKRKEMTQWDAWEATGVDRKTLAKIDRGEEVKEQTLQKLANGLCVPISFLLETPSIKLVEEDGEWTRAVLTLRKLDVESLSALLKKTKKIEWYLFHLPLVDDKVFELIEQFGRAVEQLHCHFNYSFEWEPEVDPFSLGAQLIDLKRRRVVVSLMDQLAGECISVFGADYIQWHVKDFSFLLQPGDRHYHSTRLLALSVAQSNTRSPSVPIFPGSAPPKFAPETNPPTKVFVDGVQLPPLKQEESDE
jgi:hypothetical protein